MVTPSVDVSVGGLDTTADTSSIDPIIPVSVVAGFLVIVLLVLGVFFLIIIYRRCKNGIPSKSENVPNHFENAGAECKYSSYVHVATYVHTFSKYIHCNSIICTIECSYIRTFLNILLEVLRKSIQDCWLHTKIALFAPQIIFLL